MLRRGNPGRGLNQGLGLLRLLGAVTGLVPRLTAVEAGSALGPLARMRAFSACVAHGSTIRAADILHVSRPRLSARRCVWSRRPAVTSRGSRTRREAEAASSERVDLSVVHLPRGNSARRGSAAPAPRRRTCSSRAGS